MHLLARIMLCAATTSAVLAASPAPPATAATATVSPGDAITHVAGDGSSRCTLGFVFNAAGTTYGVTAGHCRGDGNGYVENTTTGAIGHFLTSRYDPATPVGADYGLIDFGDAPAGHEILGMPVTGVDDPDGVPVICHTGISSGLNCGQLRGPLGEQYSTTGMPRSIPGDSGGPVWTLRDGGAVIVGIWLGEHLKDDGTRYGRFIALSTALRGLGITEPT